MSKVDTALKVLRFAAEKVVDGLVVLTAQTDDEDADDRGTQYDSDWSDQDEYGLPIPNHELTSKQRHTRMLKMDYLYDD